MIVKVIGEDVIDQSSWMRCDPCWFRDKRIETIAILEINEIIGREMWVSVKDIDVKVTKKET